MGRIEQTNEEKKWRRNRNMNIDEYGGKKNFFFFNINTIMANTLCITVLSTSFIDNYFIVWHCGPMMRIATKNLDANIVKKKKT